jgi:hypothetical protein
MICVLYRSSLVLSILDKGILNYKVVAVISLLHGSIETSNNGRGKHYIILMSGASTSISGNPN